jgi:uncharacterized protein (TIGR02118 family)
MYRVSVCYGQPADPVAFDAYYQQVHVPLVVAVPGLAGFSTGRCASADGRSEPAYYFVATLDFGSEAEYRAALRTPEMGAAGADTANFATGGITMFTQQLEDHLAGSLGGFASGSASVRRRLSVPGDHYAYFPHRHNGTNRE